MRTRGTEVVVTALLLAGCAVRPHPTATPTPPPPEPFVGAGTQDCGTLVLQQGQEVPREAVQCFVEAVTARRPARLVVTLPTVEGDPVTTTYAVAIDGRVEVTTDARADRFGSGRVERQTCTGPAVQDGLPSFATCSSPELV